MSIRNFADVQVFEAELLARRTCPVRPTMRSWAPARRWPEAKALSAFLTADAYDRAFWTLAELRGRLPRGRQGRACGSRSGRPRP
jgi:hypothetical protein